MECKIIEKKEDIIEILENCSYAKIEGKDFKIEYLKIYVSIPLSKIKGLSTYTTNKHDFEIITDENISVHKYSRYENEEWQINF